MINKVLASEKTQKALLWLSIALVAFMVAVAIIVF